MEGNDDCGQMSAWYVLSALGFYPLDPTTGEYVIGSPLVRSATLKVGAPFAPATFRVVVRNQSRDNWRVRSVTLDGRPLTGGRLRHADIVKGGELVFEMDDGLPPLAGDGVTDDTAAIQARLDAGLPCVYLPPPKGYLISKTLRIGSDTELRLDRFSVVRLAPGSDCPMVENRGYVGGSDRRIALTGGVWDMANLDQSPNPQQLRRCTGDALLARGGDDRQGPDDPQPDVLRPCLLPHVLLPRGRPHVRLHDVQPDLPQHGRRASRRLVPPREDLEPARHSTAGATTGRSRTCAARASTTWWP